MKGNVDSTFCVYNIEHVNLNNDKGSEIRMIEELVNGKPFLSSKITIVKWGTYEFEEFSKTVKST